MSEAQFIHFIEDILVTVFCNSEKNNAAINILYMPINIPKYALI